MFFFSGVPVSAVVENKLQERNRKLAAAGGDESLDTDAYLNATASEIVSSIAEGKWTASEVLEVYIKSAIRAHELTNCATEIMFDEARIRAKRLDFEFSSTKQLQGPLHGVPFSLKDQFDYEGFDSTIGYTQWADKPAYKHATLVSQIIEAGGVPFIKTNVPQTMLAFECNNPLWGRSLSPYNGNYSCGGSSGGECALLALDGSAMGIGSDIGGSLRIPAAYCGVYSLKPGSLRLSVEGARDPNPGFEGIKSVVGPIARSVADLQLFARTLFGLTDPYGQAVPLPYRDTPLPTKLKFGYYTTDGFIKASPANKRAILQTVEALRTQGHECVEFMPPDAHESLIVFVALSSSDAYNKLLSHLGPDAMDPSLTIAVYAAKIPRFLTSLAAWCLNAYLGDAKAAAVTRVAGAKSYEEYSQWVERRKAFVAEFQKKVWDHFGFDGIIAPVQAMPQIPHGTATMLSPLCVSTVLYNVLDMPAGVLPVTRVDPEMDKLTEEWTIRKEGEGSAFVEDPLYRNKSALYDVTPMKGMPVSIQVVGKKWEEEKVLKMMELVDNALGERGFGPGAARRRSDTIAQ